MPQSVHLKPQDNQRLLKLCGQNNEHIKLLEQYLHIDISQRGFYFEINGAEPETRIAAKTLQSMYQKSPQNPLDYDQFHLELMSKMTQQQPLKAAPTLSIGNRTISARTRNQAELIEAMRNAHYTINFAIGPAGCGKTYLAIAAAVEALNLRRTHKIILTRPAVEAGENLGFLPGDMSDKIAPYLQPLYDALHEFLGKQQTANLIDKNIIEIAPIAFMRGRTLKDSFIIVDEAQNVTCEQLKMLLTRIGNQSKMIIAGDITQTDLGQHKKSGLKQALMILKDIQQISFNSLTANDILRHPVVQQVVDAYAKTDR